MAKWLEENGKNRPHKIQSILGKKNRFLTFFHFVKIVMVNTYTHMRHSYLRFKWNLGFYKTFYPSKYGKSNQVNFLFMLIPSKNKMSDICPTTLNDAVFMLL